VHVHAEGLSYTMREESGTDTRCQDGFFRIPRTRSRRIRGLEDAKPLESFDECAMASQLYFVPVQTSPNNIE
jgi:hypothetical protein